MDILKNYRKNIKLSTQHLEFSYTKKTALKDMSGQDFSENDTNDNGVYDSTKHTSPVDIQKKSEKFFSSGLWRILYMTKKFVQRLPSFEISKFDMEYAGVMYSNYLRISYNLTDSYTPHIIINGFREAINYHSILKTLSDNIVLIHTVYDADLNEDLFPAMKLNVDQRVIILDFHIYKEKILLNTSFDCLFFDINAIYLFLQTANSFIYKNGTDLPTKLTVMYNPIKYGHNYFVDFSNFLINLNASMTLSAFTESIQTQSDLNIETSYIQEMNALLESNYNIILSEYSLTSFIYTIFMLELYKNNMKDTDTFSIMNTEFVRDKVSPNSLGNFIFWYGPEIKTKGELSNFNIFELLAWWNGGQKNFDIESQQVKPSSGDSMIVFEDWTSFETINSNSIFNIYYDTLTFFPIGGRHIDCSKSTKVRLNLIQQDGFYRLNKQLQFPGLDIENLWYEQRLRFQMYFSDS